MTAAGRRADLVGYAAALLAISFWGGNYIIASTLAGRVPPAALTFWRWTAALLLLAWLLPRLWRQRSVFLQHKLFFLCASLTGIGYFHYAIYSAAATVGVHTLALLAGTSGVFVIALSPLLGRRVTRIQAGGALLSLLGLAVLIGRGEPRLWLVDGIEAGNWWMISAALSWAVYSLIMERRPTAVGLSGHTACVVIGVVLLTGPYLLELRVRGPFEVDPMIALCFLYLAILPSVVCYALWMKSLEIIGAVRIHAIYYALPAVTAIEALLILGEPLHAYHAVAGALIIGGAVVALRRPQPVG